VPEAPWAQDMKELLVLQPLLRHRMLVLFMLHICSALCNSSSVITLRGSSGYAY
jgi:hypothetical protein